MFAATCACAGEIRILSAEAPRDALEGVGHQFEKARGDKAFFEFMTAGQVRDRIEAGAQVDLAIASSGVIGELAKSGKTGVPINLGRIGLAIAVREGLPIPDISTPEKFAATLRAVKSIAFTDPAAGGTAGQYFAKLLQRLGVADEVKGKAVLSKGGRDAA